MFPHSIPHKTFVKKEGDFGLQEVVAYLTPARKPDTPYRFDGLKIVRTPTRILPAPLNSKEYKAESYVHAVYANACALSSRKHYFFFSPEFPDTQDGLDKALALARRILLDYMKESQLHPKKWKIFKKRS